MCAKFFAHICTISLKLCVEPVVCARRLRILRALIAFSCRQQLYGLFCHRSLSSALGDREYFVLSSPSLAASSSLNIVCSRRKRRVFLMCAKFFAHICTISLKLCVEPVVCARRLRILRALIAFSCQQQLYGLFCHRSLSAAVLFVLVFST